MADRRAAAVDDDSEIQRLDGLDDPLDERRREPFRSPGRETARRPLGHDDAPGALLPELEGVAAEKARHVVEQRLDRLGLGGHGPDRLLDAEKARSQSERTEHRAQDRHGLPHLGGQARGGLDGDARPGIAGDGIGERGGFGGVRDQPAHDGRGFARRELDLATVGLGLGRRVDGGEHDRRPIAIGEGHDRLELGAGDADEVLDGFARDLEPGAGRDRQGEASRKFLYELG